MKTAQNPQVQGMFKNAAKAGAQALGQFAQRRIQQKRAGKMRARAPLADHPTQSVAAAPVRMAAMDNMASKNTGNEKRTELSINVTQQNANGLPVMTFVRICPGTFPTLATESSKWQYYNFKSLRVTWVPQRSTQTNGTLWFAPVSSYQTMQSLKAADIDAMQQLVKTSSASLWQTRNPVVYLPNDFKKLTNTGTTRFQVMASDSYDDSQENQVQGWLAYTVWGYDNYTDLLGQLKISYSCDFTGPQASPDGDAVTEQLVTAASGLAATVTALNADRFGKIPFVTYSEPVTGTLRITLNRKGSYFVVQDFTGATLTVAAPAAVAGTYGAITRIHNISSATKHTASYVITAAPGFSADIAITNHANITASLFVLTSARKNAVAWQAAL